MTERVRWFTPIDVVPLPRPLCRFGNAFPRALAETYTGAYTARRGVVLDPLAHPWSAADAAERCDRRGIARSPQPLGAWAREAVRRAPTPDAILAALATVADSTLASVPHAVAMRELYSSRCATCRGPIVVEAYLWERDAPVPTKKAFRCGICAREGRSLLIEPVGHEDEERTARLEERGLAFWQMVERFGDAELGQSVAALYTPRNLMALMATVRAVETALHGSDALDLMRLCLVEVIVAGSRLSAVAGQGAPLRIEKGRARRGHASQFRETNVWLEYERTVRELATWLAGHPSVPIVKAPFVDLDPGGADLVLAQASAEDQLGGWAHVASVVLGVGTGRAPDTLDGKVSARERTLRVTRQALLEAHRASRDGAIAVVYVPQADIGAMAAVALAGTGAGWRVRSVLYQPDALGSSAGAAIVELDRHAALLGEHAPVNGPQVEATIRTAVRDAILARGHAIDGERAAAAALEALAENGALSSLALARSSGVSELEVFMDHFKSSLADGHRDGIRSVGEEKHVYDLATAPERAPLDDRVEWSVWGLLAAARDVDTTSVLRRTYALFRGAETPDREIVERGLSSYGLQGTDGRWRLRADDGLVQRNAEQALLVAHLAEAGHRLGFQVHVGREVDRRPMPESLAGRGELVGDLMTAEEREASLARYVRGASEALDFVDVIWYGRAHMAFVWMVDRTARLHHPVIEIGEQIADDERVFRFLAVPEERKALVVAKLTRSATLADVVRRRGWRFVKWAPLKAFAADPAVGLGDLEPVLGLEPAVERSAHQLSFQW